MYVGAQCLVSKKALLTVENALVLVGSALTARCSEPTLHAAEDSILARSYSMPCTKPLISSQAKAARVAVANLVAALVTLPLPLVEQWKSPKCQDLDSIAREY